MLEVLAKKVDDRTEWKLLRAESDEDASILDLTTEGDFDNMPSGAVHIPASELGGARERKIEIIFCGGAAAGKTFDYRVYAWRANNGPAEFVCSGTGTLGTQAVVKYPHNGSAATNKFWAHSLSVTSRWIKSARTSDTSGNNEIAKLSFDLLHRAYLYVEIENADGVTGDEAGDMSAYWSWIQ